MDARLNTYPYSLFSSIENGAPRTLATAGSRAPVPKMNGWRNGEPLAGTPIAEPWGTARLAVACLGGERSPALLAVRAQHRRWALPGAAAGTFIRQQLYFFINIYVDK